MSLLSQLIINFSRATGTTSTAGILFLYGFNDDDQSRLESSQKEAVCSLSPLVVCGNQKSRWTDVRELKAEAHEIRHYDEVAAFYQAKVYLDSQSVEYVTIMCSKSQFSVVDELCKCFFTPVYKWKILSPNSEKMTKTDIGSRVSAYLQTLPSREVKFIKSPLIPDDVFYHGFCERNGGISTVSGMASLNMVFSTTKRDPQCVIDENHRRLAERVPFRKEGLQIARAVHGNTIYIIGQDIPQTGYDGVLTNAKNVTCGAPGADCIIMLFADPDKRVCGAIHSGWKGTVARICVEMLNAMKNNFGSKPDDILVVMGPSICKNCFEFGIEDSKVFSDISENCVLWNNGKDHKPTIDLKLANRILLESEGIPPTNIDDTSVARCTVENPETFFSYRRDGRPFGYQIGFIGIK